MDIVTTDALTTLLSHLGKTLERPTRLYLVGGCALLLLGSTRATTDIDYDMDDGGDPASAESMHLRSVLASIARGLRLDVEYVPMAEFVPLPPGSESRHLFFDRFGLLEVFIFDPYSLALSKIARGLESDLDDIVFLHRAGIVMPDELRRLFATIVPHAETADIDPSELKQYFAEAERRVRQADA